MGARPDIPVPVFDDTRRTTCYMCACRCGIDVQACAAARSPTSRATASTPSTAACSAPRARPGSCSTARPRACARRCGAWGSGARASSRRSPGRRRFRPPPRGSARCARRTPGGSRSSPGATSRRASPRGGRRAYGTPNYAAHGGFCSVNMAAAGIYTLGGSFWEFGQPDWERARLFLLFGCAEDHDSNPIKMGLARLKERGVPVVAINPIRTGYNAVADEWVGITPGTDGLLVLALVHCLLASGRVDLDSLARWTDAAVLLDADPASEAHLMPLDGRGRRAAGDGPPDAPSPRRGAPEGVRPDLAGRLERGGHVAPHRVPAPGPALPRAGARARGRGGALRGGGPPHPRAGGQARGGRPSTTPRLRPPALDRLPRRAARGVPGAPRGHARHARHLGARQRLPDLPRDPPAPGAARGGGRARELPLQAALPQALRRPSQAPCGRAAAASRSTAPIWATRAAPRTCW